MITGNRQRAKSSAILRKTNHLLSMNLNLKTTKERKRKPRRKSFKAARCYSQPAKTEKSQKAARKSIKYQACMRQKTKIFEQAQSVYSDKIYSLKTKISLKDENLKKLKRELKEVKISKKSFDEVCELNSILVIKMRRLQYVNEKVEKELGLFKNQLTKMFEILKNVKKNYTKKLHNVNFQKQKEIEILRNLNELNLKQMNDKFDSLVRVVQDTKIELESRGGNEEEMIKRLNTELIEKVNDATKNNFEKNNAKIDFWRTNDDYHELKTSLRKVENEFERKEIEYKNEILDLKNRLRVKVKDEKVSMRIKVGKEIQSNLQQSNLLKNKIKTLNKDNFSGSKTSRCSGFERKEKVFKGRNDGFFKGNYFGKTVKGKKHAGCSLYDSLRKRNNSLGIFMEYKDGYRDADSIADSLLRDD